MAKKSGFKKGVAVLLIALQLAGLLTSDAQASPRVEQLSAPAIQVAGLRISEKWGRIQNPSNGQSGKTLLVIEDAHAVPSAQKSIWKVIEEIRARYGAFALHLEGLNEASNLAFEHSFPDRDWLRKKIEADVDSQNISGGAAALISSDLLMPQAAESKELYFKAVELYQSALSKQASVLKPLERAREIISKSKQKSYSAEALKWDRFMIEDSLEALPLILQLPANTLANRFPHLEAVRRQVQVQNHLKRPAMVQFWQRFLGVLAKKSSNPADRLALSALQKDVQSGRLSVTQSAQKLEQILPAELFNELSALEKRFYLLALRSEREWKEIKTAELAAEYQHFLISKLTGLFTKSAQHLLLKQTLRIRLLEKLVRMELSWVDWQEAKKMNLEHPDWQVFIDFYAVQFEREEKMRKHIADSFRSSETVVFVSGGFHRQGLEQIAKKQGWNFAVITPQVLSLEGSARYAELMQGSVGWRSHMKVVNGRIDLQKAYWSYLVKAYAKDHPDQIYDLLLNWRKRLILRLADLKQLNQAVEIATPIHAWLVDFMPESAKQKFRTEWLGLQNLQTQAGAKALPASMTQSPFLLPFGTVPADLIAQNQAKPQKSVVLNRAVREVAEESYYPARAKQITQAWDFMRNSFLFEAPDEKNMDDWVRVNLIQLTRHYRIIFVGLQKALLLNSLAAAIYFAEFLLQSYKWTPQLIASFLIAGILGGLVYWINHALRSADVMHDFFTTHQVQIENNAQVIEVPSSEVHFAESMRSEVRKYDFALKGRDMEGIEQKKIDESLDVIRGLTDDVTVTWVIPAYNETERLRKASEKNPAGENAFRAKARQLKELRKTNPKFHWRMILVDDGSPDLRTYKMLSRMRKWMKLDPQQVQIVRLDPSQKKGPKGGAVNLGMQKALEFNPARGAHFIGYTDMDLSTNLILTGLMLGHMDTEGSNVAIGVRRGKGAYIEGRNWQAKLSSLLYNLAIRFLLSPLRNIKDTQAGFKLFYRPILEAHLSQQTDFGFSFDAELLLVAKLGRARISQVPLAWFDSVSASQFAPQAVNRGFEALRTVWNFHRKHLINYKKLRRDIQKIEFVLDPVNKAWQEIQGTFRDHSNWITDYLYATQNRLGSWKGLLIGKQNFEEDLKEYIGYFEELEKRLSLLADPEQKSQRDKWLVQVEQNQWSAEYFTAFAYVERLKELDSLDYPKLTPYLEFREKLREARREIIPILNEIRQNPILNNAKSFSLNDSHRSEARSKLSMGLIVAGAIGFISAAMGQEVKPGSDAAIFKWFDQYYADQQSKPAASQPRLLQNFDLPLQKQSSGLEAGAFQTPEKGQKDPRYFFALPLPYLKYDWDQFVFKFKPGAASKFWVFALDDHRRPIEDLLVREWNVKEKAYRSLGKTSGRILDLPDEQDEVVIQNPLRLKVAYIVFGMIGDFGQIEQKTGMFDEESHPWMISAEGRSRDEVASSWTMRMAEISDEAREFDTGELVQIDLPKNTAAESNLLIQFSPESVDAQFHLLVLDNEGNILPYERAHQLIPALKEPARMTTKQSEKIAPREKSPADWLIEDTLDLLKAEGHLQVPVDGAISIEGIKGAPRQVQLILMSPRRGANQKPRIESIRAWDERIQKQSLPGAVQEKKSRSELREVNEYLNRAREGDAPLVVEVKIPGTEASVTVTIVPKKLYAQGIRPFYANITYPFLKGIFKDWDRFKGSVALDVHEHGAEKTYEFHDVYPSGMWSDPVYQINRRRGIGGAVLRFLLGAVGADADSYYEIDYTRVYPLMLLFEKYSKNLKFAKVIDSAAKKITPLNWKSSKDFWTERDEFSLELEFDQERGVSWEDLRGLDWESAFDRILSAGWLLSLKSDPSVLRLEGVREAKFKYDKPNHKWILVDVAASDLEVNKSNLIGRRVRFDTVSNDVLVITDAGIEFNIGKIRHIDRYVFMRGQVDREKIPVPDFQIVSGYPIRRSEARFVLDGPEPGREPEVKINLNRKQLEFLNQYLGGEKLADYAVAKIFENVNGLRYRLNQDLHEIRAGDLVVFRPKPGAASEFKKARGWQPRGHYLLPVRDDSFKYFASIRDGSFKTRSRQPLESSGWWTPDQLRKANVTDFSNLRQSLQAEPSVFALNGKERPQAMRDEPLFLSPDLFDFFIIRKPESTDKRSEAREKLKVGWKGPFAGRHFEARSWQEIEAMLLRAANAKQLDVLYVDLDNTTFSTRGWHGSEGQIQSLIQKLTEKFSGEKNARSMAARLVFPFVDKMHAWMKKNGYFEPASDLDIGFYQELRKKGVRIVAVTARPQKIRAETIATTTAIFGEGAIAEWLFTDGAGIEKLKAIQKHLKSTGIAKDHALLVDDFHENVEAVDSLISTIHLKDIYADEKHLSVEKYLARIRTVPATKWLRLEYALNALVAARDEEHRRQVRERVRPELTQAMNQGLDQAVQEIEGFLKQANLKWEDIRSPGLRRSESRAESLSIFSIFHTKHVLTARILTVFFYVLNEFLSHWRIQTIGLPGYWTWLNWLPDFTFPMALVSFYFGFVEKKGRIAYEEKEETQRGAFFYILGLPLAFSVEEALSLFMTPGGIGTVYSSHDFIGYGLTLISGYLLNQPWSVSEVKAKIFNNKNGSSRSESRAAKPKQMVSEQADELRRKILRSLPNVRSDALPEDLAHQEITRFAQAVHAAPEMENYFDRNFFTSLRENAKEARHSLHSLKPDKLMLEMVSVPVLPGHVGGITIFNLIDFTDSSDRGTPVAYAIYHIAKDRDGQKTQEIGVAFNVFKAYRNHAQKKYSFKAHDIYNAWQAGLVNLNPVHIRVNSESQITKARLGDPHLRVLFYLSRGYYPPDNKEEADRIFLDIHAHKDVTHKRIDAFLKKTKAKHWILPVQDLKQRTTANRSEARDNLNEINTILEGMNYSLSDLRTFKDAVMDAFEDSRIKKRELKEYMSLILAAAVRLYILGRPAEAFAYEVAEELARSGQAVDVKRILKNIRRTQRIYGPFARIDPGYVRADMSSLLRVESLRRYVSEKIGKRSRGGKLLSVGVGIGILEDDLIKHYQIEVTGTDVVPEFLQIINQSEGVRSRIRTVVAHGELLPFAKQSYDTVIYPESIGHLDLKSAVQDAARVLKPGGSIFIMTYPPKSKLAEEFQYNQFSKSEIEEALADSGFKDIAFEMTDRKKDYWVISAVKLQRSETRTSVHPKKYMGINDRQLSETEETALSSEMNKQGPLPIVEAPPAAEVERVFRLFEADAKVTQDDLEVIIRQAVYESWEALLKHAGPYMGETASWSVHNGKWASDQYPATHLAGIQFRNPILYLSADFMVGWCTSSSLSFHRSLYSLSAGKIKSTIHGASLVFGGYLRHVVQVVQYPGLQPIYVDVTGRQLESHAMYRDIDATPGARPLFNELFEKGYVGLSPENAEKIGLVFRRGQAREEGSDYDVLTKFRTLQTGYTSHDYTPLQEYGHEYFHAMTPEIARERSALDEAYAPELDRDFSGEKITGMWPLNPVVQVVEQIVEAIAGVELKATDLNQTNNQNIKNIDWMAELMDWRIPMMLSGFLGVVVSVLSLTLNGVSWLRLIPLAMSVFGFTALGISFFIKIKNLYRSGGAFDSEFNQPDSSLQFPESNERSETRSTHSGQVRDMNLSADDQWFFDLLRDVSKPILAQKYQILLGGLPSVWKKTWAGIFVPSSMDEVIQALKPIVTGEHDFVDLGSGLNTSLIVAAHLGAHRAVGIEGDDSLFADGKVLIDQFTAEFVRQRSYSTSSQYAFEKIAVIKGNFLDATKINLITLNGKVGPGRKRIYYYFAGGSAGLENIKHRSQLLERIENAPAGSYFVLYGAQPDMKGELNVEMLKKKFGEPRVMTFPNGSGTNTYIFNIGRSEMRESWQPLRKSLLGQISEDNKPIIFWLKNLKQDSRFPKFKVQVYQRPLEGYKFEVFDANDKRLGDGEIVYDKGNKNLRVQEFFPMGEQASPTLAEYGRQGIGSSLVAWLMTETRLSGYIFSNSVDGTKNERLMDLYRSYFDDPVEIQKLDGNRMIAGTPRSDFDAVQVAIIDNPFHSETLDLAGGSSQVSTHDARLSRAESRDSGQVRGGQQASEDAETRFQIWLEAQMAADTGRMVELAQLIEPMRAQAEFKKEMDDLRQAVVNGSIAKAAPVIFYSSDIHDALLGLVKGLRDAFKDRPNLLNLAIVFPSNETKREFETALEKVDANIHLLEQNTESLIRLNRMLESKEWQGVVSVFFAPQFFVAGLKLELKLRAVDAPMLLQQTVMPAVPKLIRYFSSASIVNAQTLAAGLPEFAAHMRYEAEAGWTLLDSILETLAILPRTFQISA